MNHPAVRELVTQLGCRGCGRTRQGSGLTISVDRIGETRYRGHARCLLCGCIFGFDVSVNVSEEQLGIAPEPAQVSVEHHSPTTAPVSADEVLEVHEMLQDDSAWAKLVGKA